MKRFGLIGLLMVGAAASASGQQPATSKDEIPAIPAEYKPPKGMCRIWIKDVPAKQQPAPTDCASAVKNVPQNGRVVFGDTEESKASKPKELPKGANGFAGKSTPPPIVVPKKPPLGR